MLSFSRTCDEKLEFDGAILSSCLGNAEENDEEAQTPLMYAKPTNQTCTGLYRLEPLHIIMCMIVAAFFFTVYFSIKHLPASCWDVEGCRAELTDTADSHKTIHMSLGILLLGVLLSELPNLMRELQSAISSTSINERLKSNGFEDFLLSTCMVCFILIVLCFCQLAFASGWSIAHSVPAGRSFVTKSGPVHSLRYVEWYLNLPVLLGLLGHVGLHRPVRELIRPVVVTNLYIYVSWLATITDMTPLCIFLVALSFVGYGCASYDMLKWADKFLADVCPGLHYKTERIWMLHLIIILFGFYGIVYLCGIFGLIKLSTEHIIYAVCDAGAKIVLTLFFARLRSEGRRVAIEGMVCKYADFIQAFSGLLRCSFDIVLPCSVSVDASCVIQATAGRDLVELEAIVGRSLSGVNFLDLLATDFDRALFKALVRNSLDSAAREPAASLHLNTTLAARIAHMMRLRLSTTDPESTSTSMLSCTTYLLCLDKGTRRSEHHMNCILALQPIQDDRCDQICDGFGKFARPEQSDANAAIASRTLTKKICGTQRTLTYDHLPEPGDESGEACSFTSHASVVACSLVSPATLSPTLLTGVSSLCYSESQKVTEEQAQLVDCATQTVDLSLHSEHIEQRGVRNYNSSSSSSQRSNVPSSLDGCWVLDQSNVRTGQSLRSFRIQGSKVYLGNGSETSLVRSPFGPVLEGNVIKFHHGRLHRVGMDAKHQIYVRAEHRP